MLRYLCSCICLYVSLAFNLYGQQVTDTLALRIEAMQYERSAFDAQSPDSAAFFRLKKSKVLKEISDYNEINLTLSKVDIYELTDFDLLTQVIFERTTALSVLGLPNEAEALIIEAGLLYKSQSLPLPLAIMHIILLNQQNKYAQAKTFLAIYNNQYNLGLNTDSIYAKALKFKPKSSTKAALLSTIAPGLGQFYAKSYRHGFVSGTMVLASIGFGAVNMYNGFWLTGFFVGASYFNKFYWGGQTNASYLADKYNQDKYNSFNLAINKHIIQKANNK